MKPAIEAFGLSKKYTIGSVRNRYGSIRDKLTSVWNLGPKRTQEFWALRELNFKIYPGESIGVIGKNGAGKSTLLKILSRITPPTNGHANIYGRLASLLEVGTGFHPELTGRENIFLNGSILGLKRKEINQQFESIVDFSNVEAFLDTPLKHYSSGMQLRLAFSVAAHLEPEILLIDEVLAVGDVAFQKKCIGKMDEVSRSGRTILFVSHNLDVLAKLCSKSMLIEQGKLVEFTNTAKVIDKYLSIIGSQNHQQLTKLEIIYQNNAITIDGIKINGHENRDLSLSPSDKIEIEIIGQAHQNCVLDIEAKFKDEFGINLAFFDPSSLNLSPYKIKKGPFKLIRSFSLPKNLNQVKLTCEVAVNLPGSIAYAFIANAFFIEYYGEATPSGKIFKQKKSTGYIHLK